MTNTDHLNDSYYFSSFEGSIGRDIPFDASLEVQELTGAGGREGTALGVDAMAEGGGGSEGDEDSH